MVSLCCLRLLLHVQLHLLLPYQPSPLCSYLFYVLPHLHLCVRLLRVLSHLHSPLIAACIAAGLLCACACLVLVRASLCVCPPWWYRYSSTVAGCSARIWLSLRHGILPKYAASSAAASKLGAQRRYNAAARIPASVSRTRTNPHSAQAQPKFKPKPTPKQQQQQQRAVLLTNTQPVSVPASPSHHQSTSGRQRDTTGVSCGSATASSGADTAAGGAPWRPQGWGGWIGARIATGRVSRGWWWVFVQRRRRGRAAAQSQPSQQQQFQCRFLCGG